MKDIFKSKIFERRSNENGCLCCSYSRLKRFFILFLWCVDITIFYFAYDVPGSLQNHIIGDYGIGVYAFSYLYSVYSWPNIIMCFLGGFLIDRILGVKLGLLVFGAIAVLGQILFLIGSFYGIFMLMLTGRFIFGIGCESATVAINSEAVYWFSGKELNIVFAILLNMGRIGSSIVFQTSEPVYEWIQGYNPNKSALPLTILFCSSITFITIIVNIILLFIKPDKTENDLNLQSSSSDDKEVKVVKFMDFTKFPLQYWLLVIVTGVYVGVFYSFLGQSQTSFTTKFGVSDATANNYVSFFSFFGAAISPCIGYLIDMKGRNLIYVLFAQTTGIIGFILVAYTFVTPYLSMFFLSLSMAAFLASIFGLISYIIPEHQLATAYGVLQSSMNLCLSFSTVAAGSIADDYGFEWMESYVLGGLVVTAPLLIWCYIIDYRGTGLLNMTAENRIIYLASLQQAEGMAHNTDNEWNVTKT